MSHVVTLKAMEEGRLTLEEKRALLRLARHTIAERSGLGTEAPDIPARMKTEMRGVFVTLRDGNELRGCIGYVEPVETVEAAVRDLAVKAACEDPRFAPVSSKEIPSLTIELSVLTPLQKIGSAGEVKVGIHGVVIEAEGRRGLLLPEVASEYGWSSEEFLSHCCKKAGLVTNAWQKKGTSMFRFSTEHFSESEILSAVE